VTDGQAQVIEAAPGVGGPWWHKRYPGARVGIQLNTALAGAERAGDHRLQLIGMRMVAWAHCGLGDWNAGHRLLRECLARALELQMPEIEAACANTLSQVAFRQQDMVARLHWNERELTLRRLLGDRRQESMCPRPCDRCSACWTWRPRRGWHTRRETRGA
jgi:hypothetical protein